MSPAAYVSGGVAGGRRGNGRGTVECFLSGQYRSGERGCGPRGGRTGSIPDSIPVTSLEGKLEGERKTPGRIASGRNGGWCSRDFPGVPATYRSPLSDGAATAVAAAAAAGAPACETTCSRRGSRSGGGGGGLYLTVSHIRPSRIRASFSKSTDRSRPSSPRIVAGEEYAPLVS